MHQKITKNIQNLSSPLLLFGGVYSNLQALQKLQSIAQEKGIPAQQIICTGDIVGYCAQPEQCVQEIIKWGVHCIAGNVEIQLREGEEDCGCNFDEGSRCNIFSNQWYPYAKSKLSKESIEWMNTLPDFLEFKIGDHKATVVHGSAFETAGYIFKSTPWIEKLENFHATESNIVIAGHCGLPFHDLKANKYWLNPGVIGMPANDGTPRVWYMILELDRDGQIQFTHHAYEYENHEAVLQMHLYQLTPEYAQTLKTGIWDNCEILPEEETALQGKEIQFH